MLLAVMLLTIPGFGFAAYPNAYNVVVTSDYVMSTALPSGPVHSPYKYETRVFYNYLPLSGKWGGINYIKKKWEGQWTYTYKDIYNDMDFCMKTGFEKLYGSKVRLIPYNGVVNGKEVKNGYFTGQTVISAKTYSKPIKTKTTTSKATNMKATTTTVNCKVSTTITISGLKVNRKLPYTLKQGLTKNKYVIVAQKQLAKKVKYDGYTKGNYGSKTSQYVKKFQTKQGLKATGIVDDKTWNQLIK